MKKEHPGVPGGGALRAKEAMEWIMKTVFLVCGFIAIAFVLLITVYLIISGLPAIREVGLTDFLFGTRWASTDKTDPAYGILPFIPVSYTHLDVYKRQESSRGRYQSQRHRSAS